MSERQSTMQLLQESATYHPEYSDECSPEQWEEQTTIIDRMNFARIYGFLSPRQDAAVEAAIEEYREYEKTAEKSEPPLIVAFMAGIRIDNPDFRPDLLT